MVPGVTRVGELALTHSSCSARESRLCSLSGQHIRVDPVVWGKDEPNLMA